MPSASLSANARTCSLVDDRVLEPERVALDPRGCLVRAARSRPRAERGRSVSVMRGTPRSRRRRVPGRSSRRARHRPASARRGRSAARGPRTARSGSSPNSSSASVSRPVCARFGSRLTITNTASSPRRAVRARLLYATSWSLSISWNRSQSLRWSAGWARRISLTRVISGASDPGSSRSQVRCWYFSESRYSSLPDSRGDVLLQLERRARRCRSSTDSVAARTRRASNIGAAARLEHLVEDVGRVRPEVRPEELARLAVAELFHVGLQLALLVAPREVRVRLAEAELRQAVHHLRAA